MGDGRHGKDIEKPIKYSSIKTRYYTSKDTREIVLLEDTLCHTIMI